MGNWMGYTLCQGKCSSCLKAGNVLMDTYFLLKDLIQNLLKSEPDEFQQVCYQDLKSAGSLSLSFFLSLGGVQSTL